jgi:hypothetical protein
MDKTDNEVLAEFMGIVPDHLEHEEGIDYDWKNCPPGLHWAFKDHPPFDSDWLWLMPVWYKFRDLKFTTASAAGAAHRRKCDRIRIAITSCGIPETFEELVEAVKWYNTIKK